MYKCHNNDGIQIVEKQITKSFFKVVFFLRETNFND